MKNAIVIFIILISSGNYAVAQMDSAQINKQMRILTAQVKQLERENQKLANQLNDVSSKLQRRTDSINNQVRENTTNIAATANKLGIKIEQSANDASKRFTDMDNSISKNTLYWIVGSLVTALLTIVIYISLRKKISSGNSALDKQIADTKKSMEEEGVKLDTKLTELLESQLKILNSERQVNAIQSDEVDHSLALKVADEIVRIQKNLSNMDANTKGLKQLAASVKRIQDNFEANGYEIADLLNKSYDPKMKVVVTSSIPDDTLPTGQELITRIIKPQVNFKGIMVQAAQVEISVGNG